MIEEQRRPTEPVGNGTIPMQTPDRGRPTERVYPQGEGEHDFDAGSSRNDRPKSARRDLRVLTKDLINDLQLMLKQESMLFRQEIAEKISALKTGSALLTAAMISAFVGFQALVATVIIWLAEVMPWGLSAFLVAVVLLIAGAVMGKMAKSRMDVESLKPQKSIDSVQSMGDLVQEKARDFKQSS